MESDAVVGKKCKIAATDIFQDCMLLNFRENGEFKIYDAKKSLKIASLSIFSSNVGVFNF